MGVLGNAWLAVTDFVGTRMLYPAMKGMGYSDETLAGATPEARNRAPLFHRLADGGETMTPMIREGQYVEAASSGAGTVIRTGGEAALNTAGAIPGALGLDGMGPLGTIMWALGGFLGGGVVASMVFGNNGFMPVVAGVLGALGALYLGNAHSRGELGTLFSGAVSGVTDMVGGLTGHRSGPQDALRSPQALPVPAAG